MTPGEIKFILAVIFDIVILKSFGRLFTGLDSRKLPAAETCCSGFFPEVKRAVNISLCP